MAATSKKRRKAEVQLCGFDGCTNKAGSRDRCQSHLAQFWDEIDAGKYTEDDAIASGKLAPRQKTGRPKGRRSRKRRGR